MTTEEQCQEAKIEVTIFDKDPSSLEERPVDNAPVCLYREDPSAGRCVPHKLLATDPNGKCAFGDVMVGTTYWIGCDAFSATEMIQRVEVTAPCTVVRIQSPLGLTLTALAPDGSRSQCADVTSGQAVRVRADYNEKALGEKKLKFDWFSDGGALMAGCDLNEMVLSTAGAQGMINLGARATSNPSVTARMRVNALPAAVQPISGKIGVTLQRSAIPPTADMGLWAAIRNHSKAMAFGTVGIKGHGTGSASPRGYQGFIDRVLCGGGFPHGLTNSCGDKIDLGEIAAARSKGVPLHGMAAYELLKTATEIFLLLNCGIAVRKQDVFGNRLVSDDEEMLRSGLNVRDITQRLTDYLGSGRLPYIERVVETAFPGYVSGGGAFCNNVLTSRADCSCLIELIWSYWHEEGMLVQSANAISRRFQNVRAPGDRDPLAHVTIDPLRPLNNLLWGYVQDEQNRLTVRRRGYEYDQQYGLTILGKALPSIRPADSRSKFLEAFHSLLHLCSIFYKEDNDTTVIADGFPLLNSLKEVHLLLAQGAHNQFGDLPWAARAEMLIQQWLMARPEMRDFLQSRPMVPYTEAWMPQVDTMKTLQGWSDVTVSHFHDLGVYGEQILLSVRYGDWIDVNMEDSAKNWARYWRPEIQGYLHGYRAVSGVDLTNADTLDYTMPTIHLQRRLAAQRSR